MKMFLVLAIALSASLAEASAQKKPVFVLPTTSFNKQETQAMLDSGTSTIKGVVGKKAKNPDNTFLGIVVELFPCTPYFDEWYSLRKKDKKGKRVAVMSDEAYSYRILAKASDEDGSFEYKNLKPGRYYLQTTIRQGKSKDMLLEVGTQRVTSYNIFGQALSTSNTPIYEPYKLQYIDTDRLSEFVEVKSDGQVVNIKL
jgi:hypothetical protein